MKQKERDVMSEHNKMMYPARPKNTFEKIGEEASHFWSTAVWKIKAH